MDDKKYICMTTTLMDSSRRFITPGIPFKGSDIVKETLASMIKNETVQEYNPEQPPAPVKTNPIGRSKPGMASKSGTETDQPKVGMSRKKPEIHTPELEAQKEKVRQALAVFKITLPKNARLDTLEKALEKAKAIAVAEADKNENNLTQTAGKVWNMDPAEMQKHSFEILLTAYRTQCEEYDLPLEPMESKELLIQKMSSEFVKP